MKESFTLSEETFQVLIGNEKEIAHEYLCDESYIYGIKNQYNNDPFPHFLKLYTASAKAKAPVCHWSNKLKAVDARYADFPNGAIPAECVREKIQAYSKFLETFIGSISDGVLDLREIKALEIQLDELIRAALHVQTSLSFQHGMLENGGNVANEQRNDYRSKTWKN